MRTRSRRPRARASPGAPRPCEGMRTVNLSAAGVDMGAHASMTCVPDGDDQQLGRACGTSPAALASLADGCMERGLQTAAMAATGGYWMPRCETLEARGLPGCLISAQAIQQVPGRQSAVRDCPWIQTLHSSGWLAASLRPAADGVALRTLLRPRAHLLAQRAPHILPMHKALLPMHLPWSQALSDGTGDPGQRILRAMVAGERHPQHLAAFRNARCQKDAAELALALPGPWRAEPRLVLTPALARCDFSTAPRRACEAQSAQACSVIKPRFALAPTGPVPAEAPRPPRRKAHSHRKNAPAVTPRAHILRLTGVDLVAVDGLSASLAQTSLAASGTDMRPWPDDTPCCAWLVCGVST